MERCNLLLWLLLSLSVSCSLVQLELVPNGGQQHFELTNKISISDLASLTSDATSYTFQSQLKVNSVWHSDTEQLLQVYFIDSSVSVPGKGADKLVARMISKIPDRPFYVSLINGKPSKVIAHTSRDQSLLNLERGVASLLQLQYVDGPVRELDVSGICSAFYAVKSSTRIEKRKTDCSHWDLRVNYRSEKALGVSQYSQEHLLYDLSAEGTLLKVTSTETHRISLEAKPDVGSQVTSLLSLRHTAMGDEAVEQLKYSTLEESINSLLEWYRVFDIEADVDGALSELKDTTLSTEIANSANELSEELIGTARLAEKFVKLLPLARITKETEFVEILKSHRNINAQLVDLYAAVQTMDAHNAINEVFHYDDESHVDLIEKYLQSLAVATHPDRSIIEDLLQRLQSKEKPIVNEKLRDTSTQTLAALTKQSGFETNNQLLQDVRSFLLQQLNVDCADSSCKTIYIRALQNLQDISTIPTLIKYAMEGEVKESVAAMQALKSFSLVNFNESHRKSFAQIFFQTKRRFDSSVRTLALDILIALKPTKQQLGDFLDYLNSDDSHFEIKTYVVQILRMLAEKCSRFRSLLDACLAERPKINNYHVIAQKGLTTVLSRRLSQTPAFNESLLSIQEIYQGVLKRGTVDLLLSTGREETSIFKLGIYTNGLSSFVSDSEEGEVEDDGPATAGMEIAVQGVHLRPLVFFSGQSELVGHVWSGTASELTPAYQATTLAQDHEHYIMMASGATVYVRINGAMSIDLNGKVDISLWNRNANTEIQQNSGAAVVGLMVAGCTWGKVKNEFILTNEPKLSLQADIDFYSGIKLCMQLQRPESLLTHSNIKSVFLMPSRAYEKHIRTKLVHLSPGRTLALNQKNNEMCNMIFA